MQLTRREGVGGVHGRLSSFERTAQLIRVFGMSVFKDIKQLRALGYDPSSVEEAVRWNEQWEAFLASPIGPFLSTGDPQELWKRPGIALLDMDTLARNAQELVPDAVLFKFGFLPVWTSVGGNVIAYHPDTKAFYWADHDRILGTETVLLPNTYEELPLTPENLMKALVKLSDKECGTFLQNLRDGTYDSEIDKLD